MESTLLHTHHGTAAHAPLLIDDTALLVYFLVLKKQVVTPVMQDEQTGIQCSGNFHIDIVDVIHRLVKGSVGIEVLAELHSYALQILLEGVTGEVCGAIEAHVLEEVSQSALVFLLLHGAHLLRNVEIGTLLRPLVVTDVIGQAIGQNACLDCGVQGNLLALGLLCMQSGEDRQSTA